MANRRKARERQEEKERRHRTVEPQTEWATAVIGPDFAPALSLQWELGSDPQLPAKGVAVDEDVLQTFLWLHVSEITGEPITIFARSGHYWDMADLLGIDRLGRIHVFELKKTTVGAVVARQLEQYLLGYLMQDVSMLKEEWRPRQAALLGAGRAGLLVTLAGAHAGVRTDTKGRKAIAKSLAREDPEAARQIKRPSVFRGLAQDEKVKHLVRLLLVTACRRRKLNPQLCPTFEELRQQADQLRPRLDATAALDSPYPRLKSQAVVWLVGPRVDESARERVRSWRRAGLDARWLELRVVAMSRQLGWDLYAAREYAPQRAEVVRQAITWLDQHPSELQQARLTTRFYLSRAPSLHDLGGRDLEGGRLLHRCCIEIEPPNIAPIPLAAEPPCVRASN